MAIVNPETLREVGISLDGCYTVKQVADMLDANENSIGNWIRRGILPAFTCQGQGVRGVRKVSCLQLHYLMDRSGYWSPPSLKMSAANYIFLHGREPDKTGRLSYRAKYDQAVDGEENIQAIEALSIKHRGYATKEEDPAYQLAVSQGKVAEYMEQFSNRITIPDDIAIFDTEVEESDLDSEDLAFAELKELAKDMLPLATIPFQSAGPVPVRTNGEIYPVEAAKSLGCSPVNISRLTKTGRLISKRVPGERRQLAISGFVFYIYCRRARLVYDGTILQAAVRSVITYTFQQPIPAGEIPSLKELKEAVEAYTGKPLDRANASPLAD